LFLSVHAILECDDAETGDLHYPDAPWLDQVDMPFTRACFHIFRHSLLSAALLECWLAYSVFRVHFQAIGEEIRRDRVFLLLMIAALIYALNWGGNSLLRAIAAFPSEGLRAHLSPGGDAAIFIPRC
jgi:hypothetical protein